jgi:hypothetical protein
MTMIMMVLALINFYFQRLFDFKSLKHRALAFLLGVLELLSLSLCYNSLFV